MSPSTTSRLGSQNNSTCPSSNTTSTAAFSESAQHFCTLPHIPANLVFQCFSLTRTRVPLRASNASKTFTPFLGQGQRYYSGPNRTQEPNGLPFPYANSL